MDFLELIETYSAREASLDRLYAREGRSLHRRGNPAFEGRVLRTMQFLHAAATGEIPHHRLHEAMTTSDFPLLFGTVLQRQVLGNYRAWPSTWRTIAKIRTVPDFRLVETGYPMLGGDGILEEVKELAPYPAEALEEQAPFTYKVKKYGRRMPFTWEAWINDVTGQLKDVPKRFGVAAIRSEQHYFTSLYVSAAGPRSTVYTSGNRNQVIIANGAVANNPPLSIAGLQDGFTVLANQLDPATNEPIMLDGVVLEIPPNLEITAQNILNATQIIIGADSANERILTGNWMKDKVKLVLNPSLRQINTTNGATAWYLHATGEVRPFIEAAFLQGHETPEMFMKSPDAVRISGGGLVDPTAGSFDNDSLDFKIRHIFGGIVVDALASVASEGDGT